MKRVINEQLDGNLRADVLVYDAAAGSRVYTSNGTPGTFSRNNNLVGTGADELVLIKQIDAAQRADALFTSGTDVKLSLQTNAGGFQALSTITSMASSKGVAVGQFDGDALLDIMVSTAQGLVLFRQVAAAPGTFQMQGVVSPLQSAAPMLVADINNDGRDDLILANTAILQCAPATSGGPGIFTQVETITADSTFEELTIDSLDRINILFALENEFNISIPDEEARAIRTVREMAAGVEKLTASA